MPPTITGLILTYNGERLLDRCLASLSFCDRVLVVDSFSTDGTERIARERGAAFVRRAWEGPGPQFRYALDLIDADYASDWIVSLDQDEICTPELRESILKAVAAPADHLLRCFRRGAMRVSVSGAHYSFHPQGPTGTLTGDILHYPYSSFREHLDKINSYAQQGAEALASRGKHGGIALGLLHGFGRFLRIYLLKKGFLDGRAGFINAAHGAFYAFLKYVRVDEGNWGYPYNHR